MNLTQDLKFTKNPFGENHMIELPDHQARLSFISKHPFGSMFNPDTSSGETALCWKGKHAIINGDHRKALEAIANDFGAVKDYFASQMSGGNGSSWSTLNESDLA